MKNRLFVTAILYALAASPSTLLATSQGKGGGDPVKKRFLLAKGYAIAVLEGDSCKDEFTQEQCSAMAKKLKSNEGLLWYYESDHPGQEFKALVCGEERPVVARTSSSPATPVEIDVDKARGVSPQEAVVTMIHEAGHALPSTGICDLADSLVVDNQAWILLARSKNPQGQSLSEELVAFFKQAESPATVEEINDQDPGPDAIRVKVTSLFNDEKAHFYLLNNYWDACARLYRTVDENIESVLRFSHSLGSSAALDRFFTEVTKELPHSTRVSLEDVKDLLSVGDDTQTFCPAGVNGKRSFFKYDALVSYVRDKLQHGIDQELAEGYTLKEAYPLLDGKRSVFITNGSKAQSALQVNAFVVNRTIDPSILIEGSSIRWQGGRLWTDPNQIDTSQPWCTGMVTFAVNPSANTINPLAHDDTYQNLKRGRVLVVTHLSTEFSNSVGYDFREDTLPDTPPVPLLHLGCVGGNKGTIRLPDIQNALGDYFTLVTLRR